jgi:tetratricopeptide (TPR) repeat protein
MRYLLALVAIAAIWQGIPAALAASDIDSIAEMVKDGKLQQADLSYQAILEKQPQRADVHLAYAQFLRTTGQTARAMQEFEKAVQLNPKQPDGHIALSELALQTLDVDGAIKNAEAALQLAPSARQARMAYINALLQANRISQADNELTALLSGSPKDADVLHLAYQVKAKKGDFMQARSYLQDAVQLRADNNRWMLEYCRLLENAGDYQNSRAMLEKALQRHADDPELRLQLARNLEMFECDYDGAIREYTNVLALDPTSPKALTGIDRCRAKKNDIARRLKTALQSMFNHK